MTLVLNQDQAKSVYEAMSALNIDSSTCHHMDFPARGNENIAVVHRPRGPVMVWQECRGLAHNVEPYADISAFASAYGLKP